MRHKLLRDFRNIDRYGLGKDDEDLIEAEVLKEIEETRKGKTPIHPDEEIKEEFLGEGELDDLEKKKDKTKA
jgi:hypothetical protein